MDRVIFHCDCNSYFASVETLFCPELKNVPMAVAGDPQSRHGIILAKNELAKRYGVRTAETIWSAKQKCPALVCVPPHMDKYREISEKINQIYLEYTDLVEPFSVDESFLDVTGSMKLFGISKKEMADQIRERIHREIGITISVGVSFCKVFAKLGSDYKKPDATTVFGREELQKVVYRLPVSDLLFVGHKTTAKLTCMGIQTIGDLAGADYDVLVRSLGDAGRTLFRYANGLDDAPVRSFYEKREVKSIGNGMTFSRDICGDEEIHAGVSALCDELALKLREQDKKCTVVQITIRDPDFQTIQRQKKLEEPTWLLSEIIETAFHLIKVNWKASMPIRMLTVTVSGLIDSKEVGQQLSLFSKQADHREKQEKVEAALDKIRRKMGNDSAYLGIYDQQDIGLTNRKKKK